jgi:hypothetical protein
VLRPALSGNSSPNEFYSKRCFTSREEAASNPRLPGQCREVGSNPNPESKKTVMNTLIASALLDGDNLSLNPNYPALLG